MTTDYEKIVREIGAASKDGEIKHEDLLRVIVHNKDPADNVNEVYQTIVDLGIIEGKQKGRLKEGTYSWVVINRISNWRVDEIDISRYK